MSDEQTVYTNPDLTRTIYSGNDITYSYAVGIYGVESFRSITPKEIYDGSDETEIP